MSMETTPPKRRISQREQRKTELEKQRRNRLLMIWLPIGLVVVALIGYGIYDLVRPDLPGVVDLGIQERGHDDTISYAYDPLPPAGGVHRPNWQNCGVYDQPVESAYAIHDLEHGAIWLAYQPEMPAEQVAQLRDIVGDKSYVLMTPYPNLKSPVVMTAWGKQLELNSVEDKRIGRFINQYRGGGPEAGASCSEGVGNPIQ